MGLWTYESGVFAHRMTNKKTKSSNDKVTFGDELVCTVNYLLTSFHEDYFDRLVDDLSDQTVIVSIQTTNV